MPLPPLLLLLLAGGAVAVLAAASKPTKPRFEKGKKPRLELQPGKLDEMFGEGAKGDYPAPYRYQDAIQIADEVMSWAAQMTPGQIKAHKLDRLQRRYNRAKNASMPPWRKTYTIINTVVLEAYRSEALRKWFDPESGSTRLKRDKFNAIITWAAMFFTLPNTSTASTKIKPNKGGSSLPPGADYYVIGPSISPLKWETYKPPYPVSGLYKSYYIGSIPNQAFPKYFIREAFGEQFSVMYGWDRPTRDIGKTNSLASAIALAFDDRIEMVKGGALKRNLSQLEIRRCLYDIYKWMNAWNREEYPDGEWWHEFEATANKRLSEFAAMYPMTDKPEYVIEGNLKMVDEIAWWANTQIMPKLTWETGSVALPLLVIKIVAALIAVVAPLLGPAIAGIAMTAVAIIQVIASAIAQGKLTLSQAQTLGGISVAFTLNQAGIRLEGMDQTLDEMSKLAEVLRD